MTIEEIKGRVKYGDYVTLAEMLGIEKTITAKMRFFRGNREAHEAMMLIIKSREELVRSFNKREKVQA